MSARRIASTRPSRITASLMRPRSARPTLLPILLLSIFFPAAVAAQTVAYNYARGVNFAVYKTFEWITGDCGGATDPEMDSNIRRVIQQELLKRGLSEVQTGADLLIAYQVSDRRETEILMCGAGGVQDYGPGWDDASNYGRRYGYDFKAPAHMATATGATLSIGSLVIDAYDGRDRDLVWRGRVARALTFTSDSREQKDLHRAVAKLLDAFHAKTSKAFGQ